MNSRINVSIGRYLLILSLCLYVMPAGAKANSNTISNKQRIVFIGDSITYAGHYVAYVETYMRVAHPHKNFEIINLGLPSETVSGLSEPNHAGGAFPRPDGKERISKTLTELKPDWVFVCYGINDGIYLPFSNSRFNAYKEGVHFVQKQIVDSGAKLTFLTPPDFDIKQDESYAKVIDIYSGWLVKEGEKLGWQVIDIQSPMEQALANQRAINRHFHFAKDGVHPNEAGHWSIAKSVLTGLGENPLEGFTESINAMKMNLPANELNNLIYARQSIIKDAYLSSIGHKRPRMKQGLSITEAQAKAQRISSKITQLLIE